MLSKTEETHFLIAIRSLIAFSLFFKNWMQAHSVVK